MTETFTELDVDERRALEEDLEAVDPGQTVNLSWPSSRSGNTMTVTVVVVSHDGDDVLLYGKTDERVGDIYVQRVSVDIDNRHHPPFVAFSTGNWGTGREPRLGELLAVEVVDEA